MANPVYYVSPRHGVLSPDQMRAQILSDMARAGLVRLPPVIGHTRPAAILPAPSAARR